MANTLRTWDDVRRGFDRVSEHVEDWQGIPIPLPDLPLRLHDRHPLAEHFADFSRNVDGVEMQIMVGGPSLGDEYDEETIVNSWFAWKLNADVVIFKATRRDGGRPKFFALKVPRSPDSSMDRLAMWMKTIGASDAWDLDAEYRARRKLHGMLSDRQWRHYTLTGCFLETSSRSRLTYVFRRSRPTIALTPRGKNGDNEQMRCLAVLCLHPIGYYQQSWGGCMVPSDDVIAHLTFMRGDEAGFWKAANQHEPRKPEAGL